MIVLRYKTALAFVEVLTLFIIQYFTWKIVSEDLLWYT